MRTIIIWDTQLDPICFLVVDGDYSHLDRVYINSSDDDQDKQDQLMDLVYSSDDGEHFLPPKSEDFPALEYGDKVIVAGFLP